MKIDSEKLKRAIRREIKTEQNIVDWLEKNGVDATTSPAMQTIRVLKIALAIIEKMEGGK